MKTTRNEENEAVIKDRVTAYYELMKTEKLEELEIKDEGSYIYLKRKGKTPKHHGLAGQAGQQTGALEMASPQGSGEKAVLGDTVKSPITGVFYRAPSPSSPSFVKEGDVVGAGKTLCIVEAMKAMNEVKAESGMKILKILVENGKSIAVSQDLFLVEKL
jgi:acetyl-CoA carboxylase biotin carboxyl carrier protein